MMRNQHVRGFKFRNSNRIVFIYEEEFTFDSLLKYTLVHVGLYFNPDLKTSVI